MAKHIEVNIAANCSGCGACKAICPKRCISMRDDKLGAWYPEVDTNSCIECGLCVKVCPFINENTPLLPKRCFAGLNKNDDERMKSSSGGIFISIARKIIEQGGVVFGVVFDDEWNVKHTVAETIEQLQPMLGSKYLQSRTLDTFAEAKKYLEDGRKILYTGTPCQIAGLNRFLRKEYVNLITVEVICHGVPVPSVWQSYLKETITKRRASSNLSRREKLCIKPNQIDSIAFRSKEHSWKSYDVNILYRASAEKQSLSEPFFKNAYMQAFLKDYSLRPSCYECKAKSGKSHADLTIGDFWGIDKLDIVVDDDMGISCIICRSEVGENFLKSIPNIEFTEVAYEDILHANPSIETSVYESEESIRFKKLFIKSGSFHYAFSKIECPSFVARTINLIKRKINF